LGRSEVELSGRSYLDMIGEPVHEIWMKLNDLIKDEDWDALGDDPDERFVRLLDIAKLNIEPRIANAREEYGVNSSSVLYLRYEIQTALLGAAKAEEVTEFEDDEIKGWSDFQETDADAFDAKLNLFHARTKAALRKRQAETRILVTAKAAKKLKSDFQRVREQIENSTLKPSKKKDMLRKLQDIEDELNGRGSINVMRTAWLMAQVLTIPGGVTATYDALDGPAHSVLKDMAEATADATDWMSRIQLTPMTTKSAPLAITDRSQTSED